MIEFSNDFGNINYYHIGDSVMNYIILFANK